MKKLVLLTLSFIAVLTACKDESGDFITKDGVTYKMHRTSDTGYQVHYDEAIFFYVKIRDEDGNMILNVVDSTNGVPSDMLVEKKPDTGNIFQALTMLREGDSVTFLMTTQAFFGPGDESSEYPGGLKYNQKLLIDIGVVDVIPFDTLEKRRIEQELVNARNREIRDSIQNDHKVVEENGMSKYFREKGLSNVRTLPTGTMIAITKPGSGPRAEEGDDVTVEFEIKTLAGAAVMTTKEQGKPYTFHNLGTAVTGEVYGLHDAIAEMNEGGEATIAIPFMRGFGDRQMSEDIPAFSTLVGTIKIIKVEKK